MKITIDKMFRLPDAGNLMAFFDATFDDVITVRGFRVLRGKKGMFISCPQEQGKDSKWYDQIIFKDVELFDTLSKMAIRMATSDESVRGIN